MEKKEESVQIGKIITFFIVALFLNYFLGIFFDKAVIYLTGLYVNFVGNSPFADPLVTTFTIMLLYMIYVTGYTLLSNILLSKFVGINKGFLFFHLNVLLGALLIFCFFFIKQDLGQLLISKFILGLPFISVLGILAFGFLYGKMHLFDGQSSDEPIFGDTNRLKEASAGAATGGFLWGLFSFGSMKEDLNRASGNPSPTEDFRYPSEPATQGPQNTPQAPMDIGPQPLPLDPTKFKANLQPSPTPVNIRPEDVPVWVGMTKSIDELSVDDISAILNDTSIDEDELLKDEQEKFIATKLDNLETKDIEKILKEETKKLSDNSGIPEEEMGLDMLDLAETPKVNIAQGTAISLKDLEFLESQEPESFVGAISEDGGMPQVDLTNKESLKAAGWLSALANAMSSNSSSTSSTETVQEDNLLDNLDKVFFRGFPEWADGDEQIERLYKLL